MDMGLKGCVALVTASSEGIGKAIALGLAREGANLTRCARREDILQAAADEIARETGVEVLALACDMQDTGAAQFLVASTVKRFGLLDVLVNNAGGPPHGEFTSHDDAAGKKKRGGDCCGGGRPPPAGPCHILRLVAGGG